MFDATSSTTVLDTPSAPLHDPALLAAAGFLAGYSGTTKVGYTIDLRNYWQWCENHQLHVFDARRPHVELWVRSLEETTSEVQQVTVLGAPTEGTFTLTYRRFDVTIDTLREGRSAYARSTIGRRLSTVCSFYKWCADEDLMAKNPAQDSTTLGLDQAGHRVSLDRHAAYSVATFVAGATGGR